MNTLSDWVFGFFAVAAIVSIMILAFIAVNSAPKEDGWEKDCQELAAELQVEYKLTVDCILV